ncbi:unnamed protein product [Pichia kudriavzevii]|uniref:Actin n=1 Tax=Pichia kudriavzevii TaxID=4909 RepID=A0A099P1D0_PICKU|nr:hypothetical protein JL09_g2005 [Pichia kudriavzevii]
MGESYTQPIVLDNGSGTIRCGFAGDDTPRVNYSNVLGRPKYKKVQCLPSDISEDDTFVGSQAQLKRGFLKLSYPIEHGTIEDWRTMELIWDQVFNHDLSNAGSKTEISLNDHSLLITEHPFTQRKQREKMCEILFETFGFSSLNIGMPSILSLYATGRTTGVSLDVGDGVCCISPIYDGFALPGSIKRMDLAGRDMTRHLQLEIMKNGYTMNSSSEFEIVRNMKERMCRVSSSKLDIRVLLDNENESFKLPDGKFLDIPSSSLSRPCELMFQPELFGIEGMGVHELLYNSIMRTDVDLRGEFFETIVLSGGSTMFKGFGSRMIKELRGLDNEIKIKLFASPERRNNCFIGASILSNLSTFNRMVVSRKQFQEDPDCVFDKYY